MKGKTTFLTKALTLLFVMLFSLTGARAQQTLTVYLQSENATHNSVPANTSYFNRNTDSQFIIPAEDLADMSGFDVTAIKFYTNSVSYTSPTTTVYVKEVDNTTFSSNTLVTSGTTTVYSGYLQFADGELAINFSTPFTYNGGNLLIGIKNTARGTAPTSTISFKGQNVSGNTACYGRSRQQQNQTSISTIEGASFIPQTTFTFSAPIPTDVTVSNISYNSANISWNGNEHANNFNLRCRELEFYDEFNNPNMDNWTIYTEGDNVDGKEGWYWYGSRVASYSWTGETGAMSADNWLITPLVELGGTLEFDTETNLSYPDSYAVLLSTSGKAITDFTTTLQAMAEATNGTITIDLSSYAGQTGYIAIHHVTYNGFYLNIDNFHLYSSTEITANGTSPVMIEGLNPKTIYGVQVQAVYADGVSDWTDAQFFTTTDDNPIPTEVVVTPQVQTATINWFGISDSYEVKYRKSVGTTSQDFEDSSLGDWTTIDADGDGYGWVLGSAVGGVYLAEGASLADNGNNNSLNLIVSGSFSNVEGVGALTPDNWLVSPKVPLGGSISFWAKGQDANWPYEVFGVAVSTNGNTDPADFTMVGAQKTATGEWTQYSFDLSSYSGEEGYVAIRHYDCTDMFMLDIDDIVIHQGGEWHSVNTENTSVELTGLIPNTDYEFTIIGIKEDGTRNAGTPIATFTTLPATEISLANAGDNTELIDALNGQTFDVILDGRTLSKNDKWNSLCLPFDLTIAGSILDGATAKELDNASFSAGTLTLNFRQVTTLEAGKPYIIKWESGDNLVSPVFEDVTIKSGLTEVQKTISNESGEAMSITFKGTYEKLADFEDPRHILYVGSNNNLNYPGPNSWIGAQRAYFKLVGVHAGSGSGANFIKESVIGINDEDPTGIVNVNDNLNANETIYNVAGQRLQKMQKGINIVNGKKVLF